MGKEHQGMQASGGALQSSSASLSPGGEPTAEGQNISVTARQRAQQVKARSKAFRRSLRTDPMLLSRSMTI